MRNSDKLAQYFIGAAVGAAMTVGVLEGIAFLVNEERLDAKPVLTSSIHDTRLWKEEYMPACENQDYISYNDPRNTICRDIEARKKDNSINWKCVAETIDGIQTGVYRAEMEFVDSE